MKLGLCSIYRKTAPLAEIAAEAGEFGFAGLELWAQPPHLPAPTEAAGAAARASVEAAGLTPSVYGGYLRPGAADFATRLEPELAAARGYGAPLLRVWAGPVADSQADENVWERTLADFRTLLATCGELRPTIERHGGTLAESAAGVARLLDALPDDRLTLNWQYHGACSTAEAIAEIHRFGPRLGNVHAQNHRAGAAWCVERGELDYRRILQALAEVGYTGWVELEFLRPDGRPTPYSRADERALLAADAACLAAALAAVET